MNDEVNGFIDAYRESLDRQKDLAMQNLDQSRSNAFQNIMSNANTLGMMYSNFPERQKIQYDTGSYEPAKMKIQDTYQTGLDKLRSNTTNYINQLAEINEAIDELNKATATPNWRQENIDYGKYGLKAPEKNAEGTGLNFYDANGNPIRFGTYAKRLGATTNDEILDVAAATDVNLYKNLARIYGAQSNTSHPNLTWNMGTNSTPVNYRWLNTGDNAFMNSIGLGFGS